MIFNNEDDRSNQLIVVLNSLAERHILRMSHNNHIFVESENQNLIYFFTLTIKLFHY